MADNDLQQFSRQLADWITSAIDRDRLPFRKVEIDPPLLLPKEAGSHAIVLWINRASAMAGGLILLPQKDETAVAAAGALMARALGLEHFAVWGRSELKLLNCHNPEDTQLIDWRPGVTTGPGSLQRSLRDLLTALKLKSITGSQKANLDPLWLANLLHISLTDVQEPTDDWLRIHTDWQTGEWARHALTAPPLQKILLVVCRMLASVMLRRIGHGVQPEKLEKALVQSCRLLPETLGNLLLPLPEEPDLPAQAAVRLHHLFHRLGQLEEQLTSPLVAEALSLLKPILQKHWPHVTSVDSSPTDQQVAINPLSTDRKSVSALYAEPALAAWLALQHFCPDTETVHPPVYLFGPRSEIQATAQMTARLGAQEPAAAPLRTDMLAALRLSWPGRRFRLPKSIPANWLQLLHLCGQIPLNGRFSVVLTGSLPDRTVGEMLWPVISQEFQVLHAGVHPEGVTLDLARGDADAVGILRNRNGFTREISTSTLANGSWQQLVCLLLWPEPLVDLLLAKELIPCAENRPENLQQPQQLFARSVFGQKIRNWSQHPAFGLTEKELLPAWPPAEKLKHLANLVAEDQADGDWLASEIAFWLGPCWQNLHIPEPAETTSATAHRQARPRSERIAEKLLVDGLPVFPGHYLYDHYRPELKTWHFSGPLREQGRFFSTIELADSEGGVISVESESVAGCLLLASHMNRQTDLPTNPEIAADILQRCLNDLNRLRRDLLTLCRQEKSRNPERLALNLWRRWQLPPWDLLDRLASFL